MYQLYLNLERKRKHVLLFSKSLNSVYAFVRILFKIHWFLSTNIQLNLIAQNYVFWKRKSQNIWFWDVNLGNIFLSVLMRVLQINHKGKRIWCVNIINAQYITKHLATNAAVLNPKKRGQTDRVTAGK